VVGEIEVGNLLSRACSFRLGVSKMGLNAFGYGGGDEKVGIAQRRP
jgi:hypothetical protein